MYAQCWRFLCCCTQIWLGIKVVSVILLVVDIYSELVLHDAVFSLILTVCLWIQGGEEL